MEEVETQQRAVLRVFFLATNGDGWNESGGWNTEQPLDQWHGVTVDEKGYVVRLELPRNGLEGSIPRELGSLEKLEVLSLALNKLTGSIPPQLGELSNLQDLQLAWNNLEGSIPPQLGQLSNLQKLWLASDNLEGSIPRELGSLEKLEVLSLALNKLTGIIPRELGSLEKLEVLNLSDNKLTGPIPAALIGRLGITITRYYFCDNSLTLPEDINTQTHLTKLALSRQDLVGSIPPQLAKLSNLQELLLDENNLEGSIPPELAGLQNLKRLFLNNNMLTGSIPPQLRQLANLKVLRLDHNNLEWSIPPELGSLEKLKALSLSDNKLSGSIPPELGSLKLKRLLLHNNILTGPIPAALIGRLGINITDYRFRGNSLSLPEDINTQTHLTKLDFSRQDLVGSIPSELGSLEKLEVLNLSDNKLTGSIPRELESLEKLRHLLLHNNILTGTIPAELGGLRNLHLLHLSDNQFTGGVPPQVGKGTKLSIDVFSRNKFTGEWEADMWDIHRDPDSTNTAKTFISESEPESPRAIEETVTDVAEGTEEPMNEAKTIMSSFTRSGEGNGPYTYTSNACDFLRINTEEGSTTDIIDERSFSADFKLGLAFDEEHPDMQWLVSTAVSGPSGIVFEPTAKLCFPLMVTNDELKKEIEEDEGDMFGRGKRFAAFMSEGEETQSWTPCDDSCTIDVSFAQLEAEEDEPTWMMLAVVGVPHFCAVAVAEAIDKEQYFFKGKSKVWFGSKATNILGHTVTEYKDQIWLGNVSGEDAAFFSERPTVQTTQTNSSGVDGSAKLKGVGLAVHGNWKYARTWDSLSKAGCCVLKSSEPNKGGTTSLHPDKDTSNMVHVIQEKKPTGWRAWMPWVFAVEYRLLCSFNLYSNECLILLPAALDASIDSVKRSDTIDSIRAAFCSMLCSPTSAAPESSETVPES